MARVFSFIKIFFVLMFVGPLCGCFLSKTVTVPMRAGGNTISVVPVVGKPVDKTVEMVADIIDQ